MKRIYCIALLGILTTQAPLFSKYIELSKPGESFAAILGKNKYVVAKFATDWCSLCPAVQPIFDAAEKNPALKKVVFVEIDGDEFKDIVNKHQVSGYPKIMFFKDGKRIEGDEGIGSPPALKDAKKLASEIKKTFGL